MGPIFSKITQVSIIVPDAKAYARRFWDKYGIGPWTFTDFDPGNTTEMTVRGEDVPYAMCLALCNQLNVQLELIQPYDDKSIYAEFLREHGPGIHHLAFDTRDPFADALADLAGLGNEIVQGGRDSGGMQFAYVDMMKDVGLVAELCDPPPDFVQPAPDSAYP